MGRVGLSVTPVGKHMEKGEGSSWTGEQEPHGFFALLTEGSRDNLAFIKQRNSSRKISSLLLSAFAARANTSVSGRKGQA